MGSSVGRTGASGCRRSGEWSEEWRVEWSGVEWSGVEWSGVEWRGERSGEWSGEWRVGMASGRAVGRDRLRRRR